MKVLKGGISEVNGFTFSAIECNIRYKDRLDYALIYSKQPCHAAGTFTTNKVCAAPVKLSRKNIDNPIHAILINATNANACTGATGMHNATSLIQDVAKKLQVTESSILMGSTGIIGHQLPVEKMLQSHDNLVNSLEQSKADDVAKAILTTDTIPKQVAYSFNTSKGNYNIGGIAKGSGMIAPNMATLLSYILTDAPIAKQTLTTSFKKIIGTTLNSITIDGDMSTNDTAIILAPIADEPLKSTDDIEAFEEALFRVLMDLAEMLVTDGEGVTKVVTINVINAKNDQDAVTCAKHIAESLLVKTAIFGNDPNWGRIACAAGYSGAEIVEDKLSIFFEKIALLKNGTPQPHDQQQLKNILQQEKYSVTIDLQLGKASASILTSDLTYDYVKINAEYST